MNITQSQSTSVFEIIKNTDKLPSLPNVTTQLISILDNSQADFEEIGELISMDPELTLKVLKLVNSAHFSLGAPVNSVTRAIQILGLETVRFIIIGASTLHSINEYFNRNDIIDIHDFWIHSFKCAVATKYLASICHYPTPNEGYLVGLLHDLGKIILAQHCGGDYAQMVLESRYDDFELVELEREHWGFTHADISALLVTEWHLDEALAEVIASHHLTDHELVRKKELAYLLNIANQICHIQSQETFDGEALYESLGTSLKQFLSDAFGVQDYEQMYNQIISYTLDQLDSSENQYSELLT